MAWILRLEDYKKYPVAKLQVRMVAAEEEPRHGRRFPVFQRCTMSSTLDRGMTWKKINTAEENDVVCSV